MLNMAAVIVAAGQGTRMKSDLLKVMHPIAGRPMLGHVVDNCRKASINRIVVIAGFQRDRVFEYLGDTVSYAIQEPQLGTGHAVLQAESVLADTQGDVLVIYGDNPLVGADLITRLVSAHREAGAAATLLTAQVSNPGHMGRVLRDSHGCFQRVVEFRDATPAEQGVKEIASGIYVFRRPDLFQMLWQIKPANAQGEYYLPDVLDVFQKRGDVVQAVNIASADDVLAPNDRRQMADAEAVLRRRILEQLMDSGVTVVDPAHTWVGADVSVGRDTTLLPGTHLESDTIIGERCVIGPGTRIVGSRIGSGSSVEMSVVEQSRVAEGCRVGPFAHLRAGCELGRGVEIGNYAELKNARVGPGVKIHHHSYLGDAEVGQQANIGAGVITCNYDGSRKHRTEIEDGAFIGTNVNLVAPIRIGKGAYVAAGSTVTSDVPAGALAIARTRQENKQGYVARLRSRQQRQEPSLREDET